ncbi:hypothetical protein L6452_04613 [Arctium lappa]|uniref:Uncharacterized protein n=1 Tax=Arctium lappa TaxID=4217 RepID=A0ACB9EE07_ARCLA|nr:hypothetical protein L6452_04613 [Arctium lappa]
MAASMNNNWLGFSLSPQDQQQIVDSSQTSSIVDNFNSDGISGTGDCFHLGSTAAVHSSIPSLNLPPPFGFLEPYHNHHDWNMKSSSELSMLMGGGGGGSCNGQNPEIQPPKFENFLSTVGNNEDHYMYSSTTNCSIQLPPQAAVADVTTTTRSNTTTATAAAASSSIGLSMIKNWLRNNPTPSNQQNTTARMTDGHDGGAAAMGGFSGGGGGRSNELSLSMSTGSQSSSPLPLLDTGYGGGGGGGDSFCSDNKRQQMEVATTVDSENGGGSGGGGGGGATEAVVQRKSIDTFGQRTSIYRGVTRREGQVRKGRQGGYDKEDKAARAYDLAALKYWGTTTTTNFPISNYEKEVEEMKHMTRQEYVASLRRHHQHGRWQARIGRVAGNKDLYLGTFGTQEEAAEAYDIAAIKFRGLNAVTNFEINRYDVKCILESTTLPIGGAAKRLKDAEQVAATELLRVAKEDQLTSQLTTHDGINSYVAMNWPTSIDYHHQALTQPQAQPFSMHYPQNYNNGSSQQRLWCKQEQHDLDHGSGFQDLQQIHQFFQPPPPSSVLHNLMNLDSSSMEHSYSGGGGDHHEVVGYGGDSGSNDYMNHMIMGSTNGPSQDGLDDQNHGVNNGNLYYHHQGSTYSNWVPTAIPTLAARTANLVVAHGGAPTFTVWNDT